MSYMQKMKNIIKLIILLIIIYTSINFQIFNETVLLFYLYIFLYKKRYSILTYSSLIFIINKCINLFLKNLIFFLIFEILNILFTTKRNKIMEYYVFLLTFFVYLALINVFEPMVYSAARILNSVFSFLITLILCILDLIFSKTKEVS